MGRLKQNIHVVWQSLWAVEAQEPLARSTNGLVFSHHVTKRNRVVSDVYLCFILPYRLFGELYA